MKKQELQSVVEEKLNFLFLKNRIQFHAYLLTIKFYLQILFKMNIERRLRKSEYNNFILAAIEVVVLEFKLVDDYRFSPCS